MNYPAFLHQNIPNLPLLPLVLYQTVSQLVLLSHLFLCVFICLLAREILFDLDYLKFISRGNIRQKLGRVCRTVLYTMFLNGNLLFILIKSYILNISNLTYLFLVVVNGRIGPV